LRSYLGRGIAVAVACGDPHADLEFVQEGFDCYLVNGRSWSGWQGETSFCWHHEKAVEAMVECPKNAEGTLRLYIVDPDRFMGGRKQRVFVAGKEVGRYDDFQEGVWIEVPIDAQQTREGTILIRIENTRKDSNAVVSRIEFLPKK
jgi:hypothetical protein